MRTTPTVLLQGGRHDAWETFDAPAEVLIAQRPAEVVPLVERLERAAAEGLTACGFLAYEAAGGFDERLATRPAGDLPLAWFALFEPDAIRRSPGPPVTESTPEGVPQTWEPTVDRPGHATAVGRVHDRIAAGETYQINYTLRLRAPFAGDPFAYFAHLASGHRAGWAAWLDTGRHAICSLSPELFFELDGSRLTARPMKGTAPRGRTTREDRRAADRLRRSPKERSENVMIVDMVRNDLGRVARPGTVEVSSLWDVERYPTVLQMTSTCEAATDAPLSEILTALFPSASVTGAPKVRTMELIRDLEESPRGVYTGAIGRVGPGRRATFNFAIRSVHVDRESATAEYGTGGGIVWDSAADREYDECLTKALVVTAPRPRFDLLETLAWTPTGGFDLLRRHLDRLADSADYFDRALDPDAARSALERAVAGVTDPRRVRLLLAPDGAIRVETAPLEPLADPCRLAIATDPVDESDPFLFHKTTRRGVYDRARTAAATADDVVLWNRRGEITESTVANLVLAIGGELLTPELGCGLLPGARRAELLDRGRIREAILHRSDLADAEAIHLVSSVRGWRRAMSCRLRSEKTT